jgi:LysM repeat protein
MNSTNFKFFFQTSLCFKKRQFLSLFLIFIFPSFSVFAQTGDFKKSTNTEVVYGKKYYLHIVGKGQTLYAISKVYSLSVNDIVFENPDALNGIKPGQVLKIPFQKPKTITANLVDTNSFNHIVEAGQNIYSIAKLYGTTELAILNLNPFSKEGLKKGQVLKIPGKRIVKKDVSTVVIPSEIKLGIDTMYKGIKKVEYNVALLLPLDLSNVDKINPLEIKKKKAIFPKKSEIAIQFYEGILLAIDSMSKLGVKIKLFVYDVDETDSLKVQLVLDQPQFSKTDLIIGPFSPAPFIPVSSWANNHHIAIVSPFSPANRVLFKRPTAIKVMPSLSSQLEQLALYLGSHCKSENIIVISTGTEKEKIVAVTLRNSLTKIIFSGGNDSVKLLNGIEGIESLFVKGKKNILVFSSSNESYVADAMRQLHTLSDHYLIEVHGLSSWMRFGNIDLEYLQTLKFHFFAPLFIDYDSSIAVQRFLNKYDYFFHGDPCESTFLGYDVGMFFFNSLNVYGIDFYQKLPSIKGQGLQQDFDFYVSEVASGFENRNVHFIHVLDYQLEEIK